MRCLYEVLDLDKDADDAQLKIAYRKAALRWHPDKNQDNLREAEDRFKELQNAYEVLSDKHERAWYDSHRSDILRQGSRHQAGGSDASFTPGQAPDDEINLFPYFSATCFSGYRDGPTGFYGVYEDIFARLAKQETEAARQTQGKDSTSLHEDPPAFGTSQTPWLQVSAFYSHWLTFATCKDFAWADQYNPASAPNRKVRRLMEEENRKARKGKRREFNDNVRELAAFVRKRDKRVAAYQAEEAQRRLEKEAEETKRREQERRERLQRAREYEEAEWAQGDAGTVSEEDAEEPVEAIPDPLYCLACDKSFRSQNAFANHEKSKRHLERIEVLQQMLEEEEGFAEDTAEPAGGGQQIAGHQPFLSSGQPEHPNPKRKSKKHRKQAARFQAKPSSTSEDSGGDIGRDKSPEAGGEDGNPHSEASSEAAESGDEDMLDALLSMQAQRKSSAAPKNRHMQPDMEGAQSEDVSQNRNDTALPASGQAAGTSRDESVHGLADQTSTGVSDQIAAASLDSASEDTEAETMRKKSRRRRKGKEEDCPARHDAHQGQSSVGGTVRGKDAAASCSICGANFESRTKLFAHIRLTGHAKLKH